MATAQEERISQLQAWMKERDITQRTIAERIGVAVSSVSRFLNSVDMPVRHHAKLLQLGFPPELLPMPLDRKFGRPVKEAKFPIDENLGQ